MTEMCVDMLGVRPCDQLHPIVAVHDTDEAVSLANDREYGLATSVCLRCRPVWGLTPQAPEP